MKVTVPGIIALATAIAGVATAQMYLFIASL